MKKIPFFFFSVNINVWTYKIAAKTEEKSKTERKNVLSPGGNSNRLACIVENQRHEYYKSIQRKF